jgi:four helix bundle protein
MNNPEVIMSHAAADSDRRQPSRTAVADPDHGQRLAVSGSGLEAHAVAVEAAGTAIRLVMRVPAPLKPIADQVIRAASSVPANLAEGDGRSGRDRQHHWRIAYASAKEVDAHLELLAIAGGIGSQKADSARDLFDRVRAMTRRLLHHGN